MKKKPKVITFKADEDLLLAIEGIPNRSQFIRHAVIKALGRECPLCNGTGILSRKQKRHWDDFSLTHSIENCEECNARVLVCSNANE